ncbi:hypothetical protein [Streptomyces sp. NPDC051665]|uniref:WXG100-like domain-containing protein n=1 Tax=Streptomyces sp. NPDC051665 TaxID=3154647 RepID=UPI0034179E3D
MSVDMPPELAWVARLAVGQAWPKGNEDNLQALGQAWNDAAQELKGISAQLGQSGNGVLESVGGQVADEFRGFVTQLESTLPEMAESAGQLGKLGKHTAVQVEYSKYMILGQLILLAAQIAEWAFFAPEVIPLAVTGARIAVKMILRRLLISIATGIALNVGLDAAVQTIQFLKGDRTEWSTDNTVSAVISGAIGGAMGGIFFGAGSVFAPKFAHSLFGKGILGAATGLGTAGIMYGIYHSGEDEFGSSVTAGLLGALGGGGKRRFGGKNDTVQVDPVHVNLPDAIKLDLPGLVSAEKVELTDPAAFPATVKKSTATTDAGGLNRSRGGTGTGTGSGTATRSDTSTGEQGHTVSHTADTDTTTVHAATGDTSTPVTAQHDGGLPGFATTLTSTPGTTPGTTTSTATGPATVRTGTTATAPGRVDTGSSGSGVGTGTTTASVNRPSTGGSSGTSTETGRPSTVSTGPGRGTGPGTAEPTPAVRTETGTPPPTPTRTQAGAEATGTTEPTTASTGATQAGATSRATATATETAFGPGSVTGESHLAEPTSPATDVRTDTSEVTATRETATPVAPLAGVTTTSDPGPTPPPGHHPGGGQGEAPRRALDRTPRFVVRSAFEARRFTYQGEQVADLTVRVAFRDGGGGHDTDAVWNRMADGVRQFLNEPGYHLPNGDRLHVTVLRAHPGEEPHLTVDLVGHDRAMDQRSWWADAQPVDFAHELGHQIGLRDEYRDETAPQRPAIEGSLQGDYRADASEGLRQAGLRDRHLHLIGTLVGDLGEGTGPRHIEEPASAARTQAAELPHDEEWARVWHAAQGHDRRHVWVDPVSDPLRAGRETGTHAESGRVGDEITPHAPQADTNDAHSDGTAMMTRPARAWTSDIPPAAAESSTQAQARAERSADHPALSTVPDADGFAELRHLSSTHVTEAEARSRYGMPAANFRKFQEIAAAHNLRIDVRPTNPTAVKWLEEGKLPKPKDIKAKSINELDVQLGAKAEHRGLIGYFQPVTPERGSLGDAAWKRLEARFAQRTEEFETLAPVMARLQAERRFKVEDGLVFGRDKQGEWREITGDHDVFDISTPGGTRLKGDRYNTVVGEMVTNDMAVMHGAHMDWEPSSPFSKGIFTKIVESHQAGGEPLLRFRPDVNDVELVHATPEIIRLTAQEPKPQSSGGAVESPSEVERHLVAPGDAERSLAEPMSDSEPRSAQPETDSTTQITREPHLTESEPTATHDEQPSARGESRVHEVEQSFPRGESMVRRAEHPLVGDELAVRRFESPLARGVSPVRHGELPPSRDESLVRGPESALVPHESPFHRAELPAVLNESVVRPAEPPLANGESWLRQTELALIQADSPIVRAEPPMTRADSPVAAPKEFEPSTVMEPGDPEAPVVEPRPAPGDVVKDAVAEAAPMVVEPEGDPQTPPPPGGYTDQAGDPLAPEPAPVDHDPPAPVPPPLGGRYQRSLVGITITDAPGPEELRARVLEMLPAAHRTDRLVVQTLDAEFDPANFRTQHDPMVNGGRRFQIWVGGALHDVVLRARPEEWVRKEEQTAGRGSGGKGFERAAEAKHQSEPQKTSLTTTEAGLDLAPTVIRPIVGHSDQLALVTPSVKAGGATHAADTSVKNSSETGARTALTGPTETYVSRFRYEAEVIGPDGRPLADPRSDDPLHGEVTAEIGRPETDPAHPQAAPSDGWDNGGTRYPEGRPLDVTGLNDVHADVFRHLPREQRPDGTAHNDILDFLSPKNVMDGFEHATGWGLTSKRLDLSDGGHAWLRLTMEPQTSVHEGTVSDKDTFTSKEKGEHATGRTDTSIWGLGLNGGAARRLWESTTTEESTWLTVTGGYSYAHSQAHQEKGNQTFSLEHSLEHAGTGDLVRTAVRFRVEVLRAHLSPGADGLHAVRQAPEPEHGRPQGDEENPASPRPGEVIRVRPHQATTPVTTTEEAAPGAPHDTEAPGTRPVPGNLREPLTAQRTAFVDVPGSVELERHITDQLRALAPGILPPPGGGEGRVTPQAMENQRLLRERVSRSGLRADGRQLLDGTFRITLDASHLPGLPGRTYEAVIRANTGTGSHDGGVASTAKSTVTRGHASDKAVTQSSKHTLSVGGNVRRAMNPPDTVRAFVNGGVDGSYAPSRQTVASSETQVKREFQHKGQADAFSYPVTYSVKVGPHRQGDPPGTLSVHDSGALPEVRPLNDSPLRVEVRRPEISATAPRHLRPGRLPQLHFVTHVTDEAEFRQQAQTALGRAYETRGPTDSEPPRVPELDEAVDALAGRAELPGLVSASQSGWANTLDRHVGEGRAPDAVGLSIRTRLTELTYQETLSGEGTLTLELKASGATTLADQTSWSAKGNLGPDFGLFPETATGQLTTGYQIRGGGKGRLGGQWDGADTYKQETSTVRKVSHTDTWHVYRASAEVSVAGRVTDGAGTSHVGPRVRRDHDVYVLLSDEDVARLQASPDTVTSTTPGDRRATLLERGISGGALVDIPDTYAVLREIDQQLRGPNTDPVPVAALPFADTYSPDSLAGRYDELAGPGVLDRHVQVTRAGRVVTEVLVRATTDNWHDDGARSDRPLTREVNAAHTVKGKAGSKWSAGADGNLRASVRPPVAHLNSATLAPGAAFEGGRGSSAESGVTTTVGHKTSGFGDVNDRFTTNMGFEVTVTQRTETGRFMRLAKRPETIEASPASAWVPESLTESATAAPHPHVPDDFAHPAPSAAHPFDIELARLAVAQHAERTAWQTALHGAHDLVGFDRIKDLYDTAVQVQATPRPWGDGLLGQAGAYSSWALSQGTDLAGWAVRSTLPEHLTDTVSRFLDTLTADPRLGRDHDLSQEQRLTLEQQFAVRQMFSGQSLPALFHQLNAPDSVYRVPGTSVALSMEVTGPAEELGRRDAAEDELTVAVKGESGTSANGTYNWNISPLDFTVLTDDPTVAAPLNTGRITRDETHDSTRPVTRAPGTPSRPTPDPTLPPGGTATEPGKAKVTGPASLMRQPVRLTIRGHDDEGPYGVPRTVDGHLFHWSTSPEPAAPSVHGSARGSVDESVRGSVDGSPGGTVRRPAAAPRPGSSGSHPSGTRRHDSGTDEVAPRAPRIDSRWADAPGPTETPDTGETSGTAAETVADTVRIEHPTATPAPALTRSMAFATEDATTLGPDEAAHADTLAAEVAHSAVQRALAQLALPDVLVTGHGTASVSGQPHFGKAVRIGAERAEAVREVFAGRLDAHLRELGSSLTSDAFTIVAESRGSDLPDGTDPVHDTPDARRRAVITVTRPLGPVREPSASGGQSAHRSDQSRVGDARFVVREEGSSTSDGQPPIRPAQWRARRDQAAWAVLRTERYDPARDPAADRPAPGLLAGRDVVIRAAVARIQADDGRWIRNVALHLPVRFGAGFGRGDLGAYRERLQTLLDTHVNGGRRLPGSGDQLHIDVEVEHRPDHPEAVEISLSDRPDREWDQFTFPLGTHEGIRDDARALHELLHYAGVPDRYRDTTTLFRRLERQADRTGVMADIDTIDVLDAYVRAIGEATDSGPVLRDLPYTGDGKPAVVAPGLAGAAARDVLLSVDPEPEAPARAPAAAPFAGRDRAEIYELRSRVWHEDTAMEHGRNWAGPGRRPFDPNHYHVHLDSGVRLRHEPPWTEAYVVMARATGDHITLQTPGGHVRLTDPEDFAGVVKDDPTRPPNADIVLAVRGLPEDALGLPEAVFLATGRRVWTPSGGTLNMVTHRTGATTAERVVLSGRDPRWLPTTSEAGPDHFAHLRAERLITQEYTVRVPDSGTVLFHRLPATRLDVFHSVAPSDEKAPALILPVQELHAVPAGEFPAIQVSRDHSLAIDAGGLSQHAYATERAVDEANVKLAAAGSKVRLTADPEVSLTLTRADGLPTPPLLRITPKFLTRSGRSEEEACRDFAQMVSGEVRASHVVFRAPERPVATGQVSALDTAEVTGTHHLAESLARVADGVVDPAATGPSWAAAQIAQDNRGVGGQGGAPMPGREYGSALSYEQVDDPRREALAQAARQIGINEGAWAEVGEGYLVQSISAADAAGRPTLEFNYAKPGASNESHFGYHFASVVVASEDGQSQLTLENHARVSRNRAEMHDAVELNLRRSAAELRTLAESLNRQARYAEHVEVSPEQREMLKTRARLAELLVVVKEARDNGLPVQEQERATRQAATVMLRTAPMIDGKAQWYFRSYSRRPGESMHETHAELLSDHLSAEANPLTLAVLHGHAVSAPEHRFIPFDTPDTMADSGEYKLDHLAEHLVRTGLWNQANGLPLPNVRLVGHGDGRAPHQDRERTASMATRIRDELHTRIAALLRERGSDTAPGDFTISVASGLRRDDGQSRGPEVTFDVDHWRDSHDTDDGGDRVATVPS